MSRTTILRVRADQQFRGFGDGVGFFARPRVLKRVGYRVVNAVELVLEFRFFGAELDRDVGRAVVQRVIEEFAEKVVPQAVVRLTRTEEPSDENLLLGVFFERAELNRRTAFVGQRLRLHLLFQDFSAEPKRQVPGRHDFVGVEHVFVNGVETYRGGGRFTGDLGGVAMLQK